MYFSPHERHSCSVGDTVVRLAPHFVQLYQCDHCPPRSGSTISRLSQPSALRWIAPQASAAQSSVAIRSRRRGRSPRFTSSTGCSTAGSGIAMVSDSSTRSSSSLSAASRTEWCESGSSVSGRVTDAVASRSSPGASSTGSGSATSPPSGASASKRTRIGRSDAERTVTVKSRRQVAPSRTVSAACEERCSACRTRRMSSTRKVTPAPLTPDARSVMDCEFRFGLSPQRSVADCSGKLAVAHAPRAISGVGTR